MWPRFLFCFDLKLSPRSLIHADRSRLREQTWAVARLSQSSIGQLGSNTTHMFYRKESGGSWTQSSVKTPDTASVPPFQWPTARRPSTTLLWHWMSDCSHKCFRRAVKVSTGGTESLSMRMTCAVAGQIQQLSRVRGPERERIQVQVIADWIWDRRLGKMRISLMLWSEDQEAFIAKGQWLVVTGHYSFETFSSLSVRILVGDLFWVFGPLSLPTSTLSQVHHFKRKDGYLLWTILCHVCASISVSYLNVRCVSLAVPPGPGHWGEGAVGMVKLSSLEVEEEGCEGLLWITKTRLKK